MTPDPFTISVAFEVAKLRKIAKEARSVNTELATYFNLRWHDPFFITLWDNYNAAKAEWEHTWKNLPFKYLKPTKGDAASLWPDPTAIPAEHPARAVCNAYLWAKIQYLEALNHYTSIDIEL